MFDSLSRRGFLNRSVQAGALAGLGSFAFLDQMPHVSAADVAAPTPILRGQTPPGSPFC